MPFGFGFSIPQVATAAPRAAAMTYLWKTSYQGATSLHSEFPASAEVMYADAASVQYGNISVQAPDSVLYNNNYLRAFCDPESLFPRAGLVRMPLYWFDMDALRGKMIVSAKLCLISELTGTFASDRGYFAILDTVAADAGWLSGVPAGADVHRANDPCWARMSVADAGSAWAPSLDSRSNFSDYGLVSGTAHLGLVHTPPTTPVTIDVTTIVASWAAGVQPNNGFIASATQTYASFAFAGGAGAASDRQPFLKVVAS